MSDKMNIALEIVWKVAPTNINTNQLKKLSNDLSRELVAGKVIIAKKSTLKHVLIQATALLHNIPIKKSGNMVSIRSNRKIKSRERQCDQIW